MLRIVNEPTAAALAYGLDKKKDETIAVYDLGGGTFDISILEIGEGVVEVKATNGDTHLGGDDFDQRVMDWIADEFKRENGIDLRKDRMALQRLKEAAEKAKCELSTTVQTEINLPFITADASGPKHLVLTLTRAKLESLVADLIERSLTPCREAMRQAGVTPGDIDEVILVGGQTRMPKVQEEVKKLFGKEPNKTVNPDEVVARGRRGAGGGADRRGQGPPAAGRDAAVARHRDAGRRDDAAHRRQHHDPDEEDRDLHDRVGQPALGGGARAAGRAADGARQPHPRAASTWTGIPPAPRGVPQIEVTFDIDANGILNVSARDKATSKQQNITITASSGLTKDEIERMKKEAEANAAEDAQQRESIEVKNHADSLVYSTERTLREHGDKVAGRRTSRRSRRRSARRGRRSRPTISTGSRRRRRR